MRNPELLPGFSIAFVLAFARLRFVLLSAWRCRSCGDSHLHCECKPAWLRLLL
ncbi:MAG TPA: hypothetical protein VFA97_10600 [Gaiellaceae bacterium]|nr:hypothetical protein [Gaiellaceae bacterium]